MRQKGFGSINKWCESKFKDSLSEEGARQRTDEQNKLVDEIMSGSKNFFDYNTAGDLLTSRENIQVMTDFLKKPEKVSGEKVRQRCFYLVKEDNRRLVMNDEVLAKEVINAVRRMVETQKEEVDFDSKCVPTCVERAYFCSPIEALAQQICVVCAPEGKLAEKVKRLKGGVYLMLGGKNVRFKVEQEQQDPHRKLTVRVMNAALIVDQGLALTAALRLRLKKDEPEVEFLKGGFVGKTNIFEYKLGGGDIPKSLRDNPFLRCGGDLMPMAFSGEPLCEECNARNHTTAVCPAAKARREEQKCHLCGEKGHQKAMCPKREPLKCFACSQAGHFKSVCPNVQCFRCGAKGHMVKTCMVEVYTSKQQQARNKTSRKKTIPQAKRDKKGGERQQPKQKEQHEQQQQHQQKGQPQKHHEQQQQQQGQQQRQNQQREEHKTQKQPEQQQEEKKSYASVLRKRPGGRGGGGADEEEDDGPRETPLKEREQDKKKKKQDEMAITLVEPRQEDEVTTMMMMLAPEEQLTTPKKTPRATVGRLLEW